MAKRKRLCMVSTEPEGEQHNDEALDDSAENESQDIDNAHSSQQDIQNAGQSSDHPAPEVPQKKPRGPTQKKQLWAMEKNKKIKVTFNRYGKPIGDEGCELTQFLGSIVRISANVDLNCCDWRMVPKNKKEDMYSLVKEKFVFAPSETPAIKKWILSSMGKKLNTWRNLVKSRNYDSSLTVDQIVERQADKRVNPEQFKDLVTHWMDPTYQELCEQKRDSRGKMEEPHITGTKSFARLAHEAALTNNGVELTRGEIYKKSRTRKNGEIVNEKAAQVMASLEAVENDSGNTQSSVDDWRNDAFFKVKGPEKRGYVRCIGKMPSVKDKGTSSSAIQDTVEQRLAHTEGVVSFLVNIIKEHIPTASNVLRNMNIEISDNYSMDRNNSPSGNQRSSAGSGINNTVDRNNLPSGNQRSSARSGINNTD